MILKVLISDSSELGHGANSKIYKHENGEIRFHDDIDNINDKWLGQELYFIKEDESDSESYDVIATTDENLIFNSLVSRGVRILMITDEVIIQYIKKPFETVKVLDTSDVYIQVISVDTEIEGMDYAVDVPSIILGNPMENVGYFKTREEAIQFAMDNFGADANGCICLVNNL